MALGAKLNGETYRIYVILGDGESQEGSVWEAAMFAAQHKLSNLVAITDCNRLRSEEFTENNAGLEPLAEKWRAFGWEVTTIQDGHSMEQVLHALFQHLRASREAPDADCLYDKRERHIFVGEHSPGASYLAPRTVYSTGYRGAGAMKAYQDARDAVFEELYSLALRDKDVIVLSADTGAFIFKLFKEKIPRQYYNVGIAEQNMMSVAAGLTLTGKKVFVYGISNFVTMRCLEQIKIDICCMERPVTIMGMGTGYVYSSDGPTHHITEDVALMRALPGMVVLSPSDCSLCAASIHLAYRSGKPCYIRFDKGPFEPIYSPDSDFSAGVSQVRAGRDYALVATGVMVNQAQRVAEKLEKRGLDLAVIDLYRIKPVNSELLIELLRPFKAIFTLEEHTIMGGLGSVVLETLLPHIMIPVERFGVPGVARSEVGSREYMRGLDGTDVATVAERILRSAGRAV